MVRHHHSLFREGIVSGFLGGSAVALWFLFLDIVIEGRPLYTPNLLGQVIFYRGQTPDFQTIQGGAVVAYTFLHFGAFFLFGIGLTELVRLAARYHIWRFALVILVVVFEVFFVGFSFILFAPTEGEGRWWAILVGNTFALLTMGTYYYMRFPSIRRGLSRQTLGD
ncbi:MAG: hypothetical protein V3T16_05160 [Gemmatimonadales bacterium]